MRAVEELQPAELRLDIDFSKLLVSLGGGTLQPNGFTSAAPADEGRRLYDWFVAQAKAQHSLVQTGIFGADMKVHLVNDGPVTIPITIIGA